VGLLKRDHLHHRRSELELELMRGIKRVFDPQGIMNPGKIFEP
jgi:FAD/FMN-containing dehydrogenase